MAYTFLTDGESEGGQLTFGELRRRAVDVAARLTSLNAPGERALLLYPQGLEFIVAFFGCLYAGIIAVPVSMPTRKRGLDVVRGIAADAGAKWILSSEGVLEHLSDDIAADSTLARISRLDPERLNAVAGPWSPPLIDPGALALLQYTSGSTGSPCGVGVTHANLVDNHQKMRDCFQHDETTIVVSWLPMFHDMGLGLLLMPIWSGCRCVLMSPGSFVQSPRRWLAAISRYRGTTSWAPDFAYDLCVRRIDPSERAGLDLSSWTVAGNGSEPVRASTIERFVEAFSPCGFRPEAVHPGYGLAEGTLFVAGGRLGESPLIQHFSVEALRKGEVEPTPGGRSREPLVSCGLAWPDTILAIVDPETKKECAPRRVGEIWIGGSSVAAGYWGKPEKTAETFRATTAEGRGPLLRTGDLGFIENGQLFVTGRHKDLIIIRGRNYYPQDIESSVSACHPALVANGCAAFSIDSDEGEQLVIVQEVMRTALRVLDATAVFRSIRGVVSEHHALHTHAIVLLKPSSLPRTTSGKVRRKVCRQAFLEGNLPSVASWIAPVSPTSDRLSDPDSERRAVGARADRLIEWLRQHAADLLSSYASDDRRNVPSALFSDLAKQGLIGMQVEPSHGGLGLGHVDTARVIEQLAAVDFALALFVGFNNYLGIQPVAKYAPSKIKDLLLPGLVHGQEFAAFAFEEPGSRKPPHDLAVQAKVEGEDHWALFGAKYLDGIAQGASVISVFARHDEPPGLSAFVVADGVHGLHRVRNGLTTSVLGLTRDSIVMEGVKVGRENLLGSLGSGVEIAREAMMHTRLAIAAACIGGMKRCAHLVTRDGALYGGVNGKLTPNPVTLSRLGSITARVTALEALVHRIARGIDAGHTVPSEAFAACKILGPELLLRSIDDLMQLGISGGYAEANRVSSLYRDAGLLRNFDGPSEAVAELTGAIVMEEDASLRLLVEEVLGAPEVVRWIEPALEAVRQRMTNLSGALARRAQRWGHTRAGELVTWLTMLAAVDGVKRATPTRELDRAHAWAVAQFEYALAAVRFGTPSETVTLDTADVAAAFAAYARSIGAFDSHLARLDPGLRPGTSADAGSVQPSTQASPVSEGNHPVEAAKRELRSWVISWLARRLQIPVSQVEASRSFADHGLDSMASVELAKALSDRVGRELDATLLWNFATIEALVEHIVRPSPSGAPVSAPKHERAARAAPGVEGEAQLEDEIARLEEELKSGS